MPTLTVAGLARRQLQARWVSFVPTAIGLMVVLALAAAVTLTQSRTEEAGLQQTVSGLGDRGYVSVHLTGVREQTTYGQFTAEVRRVAREDMAGLVALRAIGVQSGVYVPKLRNGAKVADLGADLRITALEDLKSHVDLVSGSWPAASAGATIEVTIPEKAATYNQLALGDTECLQVQDGEDVVCVHVAGIWRPRQEFEAYWNDLTFAEMAAVPDAATYFGILSRESDPKTAPHDSIISVATATLSPDLAAIQLAGASTTLDRLQHLQGHFGIQLANTVAVSELPTALASYINAQQVAAFAVQLVAIQLLLIALYCVWFLAGNVLTHLRPVVAVWRTRGWSWRGVAVLLWFELALVALVAAPVGVLAGWAASEVIARRVYGSASIPAFHLDLLKLGLPIAAVFVVELLIIAAQAVLTSRHGVLQARAAASRPSVPWWRQRYLDLVLAILAIPLLAQTRLLGSAQVRLSGAADNPLAVVLPGVAIAFIALAALRLLPLVATLLARARGSVSARLAAAQLVRGPGQHAPLAVLLMLAVALGVFATTYGATAARNGADRAAYAAGADLRAELSPAGVVPDDIPVAGAAARSSVFRGSARVGAQDVPALGVDPYTFKSVVWTRPDLAASPLPDLVQTLADRETGGLLLPSHASMLSLWVFGAHTGGTLVAHLSDANGRPVLADFGTLDFAGWKQLSAHIVAEAGIVKEPLRFRDLAISPVTKPDLISISLLAVDGKVLEPFNQVIEGPGSAYFPGFWWRTDAESGAYYENLQPTTVLPRAGGATAAFRIGTGTLPTYIRPGMVSRSGLFINFAAPIPALVPSQMLSRLGLSVGQEVQVEIDSIGLTATIVGVADHFPTLYPELGDFLVLDRDPLLIALTRGHHQRPWPNEIWVKAAPGAADLAVASLAKAPGFVAVVDKRSLAAAAAGSPQELGLESNLVLGFIAALGLALLAFAFHFLMVARARLSEYAVMEANGMSPGQVRRSLVLEELILVGFCLVCGAALGALIALLVLPVLQLGASVPENVPATIVVVDPVLLGVTVGVVAIGALLSGPALASAVERPKVMAELRALG